MSRKDGCGHHQADERRKHYRQLIGTLISVIFIILFVILLIYLILRPTKPHFTLQDLTLYAFNISAAATTTLTSNLQITVSSRNPNARIGIYYDKIDVYATYRSQQITLATLIPPSYQGHKDITVWSPYLYGTDVPVAPYLAMSLAQDESAGTVLVNVKAAGRVRWKVGTFVSGGYRLNVNCPAYITFGNRNSGYAVGAAVKYQLVEGCTVDV
ncbi:NDR1/HIN1-like protein 1 [Lactuca sativa]|uniref:NDR1/HIN1-like protein 1 n=1 Tax=Lactuca sativa TaxID=4236 RepID=UPI000CC67A76|nr:NDR1/HIN1-like protein 1 [Lactuca sativa]